MDFLVDGGRRRHPQKETAVYTEFLFNNITLHNIYPNHDS
jgi:hypothetical protein